MYENRKYAIFSVEEIEKIDFTKVSETSVHTLRKSVDETKTFVKWDGEQPEFVEDLETLEGPYTYQEIMVILASEEWSNATEELV